MKKIVFFCMFYCSVITLPSQVMAQDAEKTEVTTELLATLPGVPWGLAQLDNNTFIYTLRKGESGILDKNTGKFTPISGLPKIAAVGQGGLLDVAVPDDYAQKKWIYFTYSKLSGGLAVTTLARAKLNGNKLVNWTDLLVTNSGTSKGQHFGSRIAFDNDGYVYFGIGDRGVRENAQNLNNHAGTIMRLKRDGTSPEIYSYGHRNPQGLTFDSKTNRLWESEHGPRGGDEINIVEKGKNYGWPTISFGKEYWGPVAVGEGTAKEGMEQPVKVYIPSIAPSSLVVYRGDVFPEWDGDLLLGALVQTHINHIALDESGKAVSETRYLDDMGERIRTLLITNDGNIYFSTDTGKIMRLLPAK